MPELYVDLVSVLMIGQTVGGVLERMQIFSLVDGIKIELRR